MSNHMGALLEATSLSNTYIKFDLYLKINGRLMRQKLYADIRAYAPIFFNRFEAINWSNINIFGLHFFYDCLIFLHKIFIINL